MSKTMNAVVYEEYGEPEVLRFVDDFPVPEPGPGEALVEVHAVGLNGYDLMARAGRYKPNRGRFPHILGGDFGGIVRALGPDAATDLEPGARVTALWIVPCGICDECLSGHQNRCALNYRYLGAHIRGAYAQYVTLPAINLIPLPDTLSYEEAAAFPNAFGTAWHMLMGRAGLQAGETVLVNSASSGVSMAAIQIAKLAGAYVYTTSSADWKLDKAKALGADETIDYTQCDFTEEIISRTNKRGVDVVVEHVGGDFLDKSIRCLTRGGRLVTVGGTKAYDCQIQVNYVFHKELSIIGSNSATKGDLEAMMPFLADGRLKCVVDKVFNLREAVEAHRYLESAQQFGKVVLAVDH